MSTRALGDLFVAELSDMLDAERQLERELPLMAERAHAPALRQAFDAHYRDTQQHVERLESLFRAMDERPRSNISQGMRGLIEEARRRQAGSDGDLLDIALITSARRFEHYEIAAYQDLGAIAARLDNELATRVFRQTLDEEQRLLEQLSIGADDVAAASSQPSPTLMPGVWATETSGFAAVPPRAESDLRPRPED